MPTPPSANKPKLMASVRFLTDNQFPVNFSNNRITVVSGHDRTPDGKPNNHRKIKVHFTPPGVSVEQYCENDFNNLKAQAVIKDLTDRYYEAKTRGKADESGVSQATINGVLFKTGTALVFEPILSMEDVYNICPSVPRPPVDLKKTI